MERQAQHFEKHVSIINRICSHNEQEIDKFNEIAQEYFSLKNGIESLMLFFNNC